MPTVSGALQTLGLKIIFQVESNTSCIITLILPLTLNCIRYPALPLVHNGGFHGTPPEKTTFPPEFVNYLYTICIYTNHNHISVSKWRSNNRFSFRVILISVKIWKTVFPTEFFNEIWLKLGDYGYINIAEIKIGIILFRGDFKGKSIFSRPPKNDNLC